MEGAGHIVVWLVDCEDECNGCELRVSGEQDLIRLICLFWVEHIEDEQGAAKGA